MTTAEPIADRIRSLDTSIFAQIESQTAEEERQVLLLLQDCARDCGEYAYLEIGSHLGGTIQPYYADPLCTRIYSIDKRPEFQPDQRARSYYYHENSSARMIENLSQAFPSADHERLVVFDMDAREVEKEQIDQEPRICFIDGEHTNRAVWSDFKVCFPLCHADAIIAFHDTSYVFGGIEKIKAHLSDRSVRFSGFMLQGSVYALLLNEAIDRWAEKLTPFSQDESSYFERSSAALSQVRRGNRRRVTRWLGDAVRVHPRLYHCLRVIKRTVLRLGKRD